MYLQLFFVQMAAILSRPQCDNILANNLPLLSSQKYMMTSSNWNIFRVTGHLCGEFTGPGEFPAQRPVTRSFDVFFDLRLNKRFSKQPWAWWFKTPSWSLWRHRYDKGSTYHWYRWRFPDRHINMFWSRHSHRLWGQYRGYRCVCLRDKWGGQIKNFEPKIQNHYGYLILIYSPGYHKSLK